VYVNLSDNGVTNAPRFAGTSPTRERTNPGMGTTVSQGDLIALAGDTGTSFHNHLHMHVLPDDGSGNPSTVFAIPYVFRDMREGVLPADSPLNDGNPKSITWYRSRNG
jgi:murein DD-endopeptidase MepM/ murein hydrolase activator NlpD